MTKKIVAAITIGQAPRTDITADILPMLAQNVELREYGALDDYTIEEINEKFAPVGDEQVLVSRMRDGSQAHFAQKYIVPLVQSKIDQAEDEGASIIVLFCTGAFPKFKHKAIFLEPEEIFHSVAEKIASGTKIGVLVPMEDQVDFAKNLWQEQGADVEITYASPYLEFDNILKAAAFFKGKDLSFICTDCMGYSLEMKNAIQEITGLPVILPRTLITRILCEFLD